MNNKQTYRRDFLKKTLISGLALSTLGAWSAKASSMKFGLVTYLWGKDWSLPELIANCEKTGYEGVELRTEHAHGVEAHLNKNERREVRKRFADSPVTCIGYGSNFEYHSPEPAVLIENIQQTKAYIQLCRDIGATGIKVKPNTLPEGISREKTISQIAKSLSEVGDFGADHGQLIRVEVHGRITQQLPVMKEIFDQVTSSNVKICWNSNDTDLMDPGLEANFAMVKHWLGDTTHVRAFNENSYPYQELFRLLEGADYQGWVLLEAHSNPEDKIASMREQKALFEDFIKNI
ncbi:sugar phosphate isomerase/epimerase family protein [Cyclobacterium jeungdonense]|uniref:Sugar phosphate isomerase/epimerase family protein n=1 Tax=Cyclobacterium jeungdonense TaxID=708087 RepID=A0ABT8CD64_9BACT|nr:TIM barrel protein [Cyclobacterium jeungdonense]MDN3690745.1 sugar phosphate isomerase/epimerase family protein [Cyclobacterium jeungdonense]